MMINRTIDLSGTAIGLSLEIGTVSLVTNTINKATYILRALHYLTLFSACRVLEFILLEAINLHLIKIQTVEAVKSFSLNGTNEFNLIQ